LPELPDVVVYREALTRHTVGQVLQRINLLSPFVLRTVDPPLERVTGQPVGSVGRIGKRLVLQFDRDLFLVFHLMIAGRLRWRAPGQKPGMGPKIILASFEFPHGTLFFTEAGSKKRASVRLVQGEAALHALDPGGIDPLAATGDEFRAVLTRSNHTLKRALTDPHLLSGIGNAYSDEILHAAKLSPMKLTAQLTPQEIERLHATTIDRLLHWRDTLITEAADRFPSKVTAFRDSMAVHGRYGKPCPVCGTAVQRIRYANNEANYCPQCQTGGRLLADRSLSRLLKDDWPRTLEELEKKKGR
jgi:formamidopyrimidine-DNA glycosylase